MLSNTFVVFFSTTKTNTVNISLTNNSNSVSFFFFLVLKYLIRKMNSFLFFCLQDALRYVYICVYFGHFWMIFMQIKLGHNVDCIWDITFSIWDLVIFSETARANVLKYAPYPFKLAIIIVYNLRGFPNNR